MARPIIIALDKLLLVLLKVGTVASSATPGSPRAGVVPATTVPSKVTDAGIAVRVRVRVTVTVLALGAGGQHGRSHDASCPGRHMGQRCRACACRGIKMALLAAAVIRVTVVKTVRVRVPPPRGQLKQSVKPKK